MENKINIIDYIIPCIFPTNDDKRIPPIILYKGKEYFSLLSKNNNIWQVSYEKNLSSYASEIIFDTRSKFKYVAYLKMLKLLWENKNEITIVDYKTPKSGKKK